MSEQFKRVYLSAVWLLFLTTPLRDIIAQECRAFSIPISPLYTTFLGLFWLLWLGYTFGTIILFFAKMHSNPRLPSNQSECRDVRIKCHIWTELELNSAVDSSLLGLINEIMSHHVLNWYSKISADPAFSSEVQSLLQYLARALILRLRHCDVTSLLKLKLIPCLLQHVHTSKLAHGARHPSLGAAARLPAYAAQAVSLLLRHATPPHAHCSPLMASLLSQTVGNRVIARGVQKLSSPLFLYRLLYRLLDPDVPPVLPRFPPSPCVPLLLPLVPAPPPEAVSLENEELALFVRFLQGLGELAVLQCLLDLREVHEMLDGPKIHKHSSVAKLRAIRDTFFRAPDKFSLPLAPKSLHCLQLILDTSTDTNDVIARLQESHVVGELLEQLTVAKDRHLCRCFMRSGTFRLHSISRRLKNRSSQASKQEDMRGRGGSIRILRMNSPLVSKKLAKAATIDVPNPDASVDRDIYRRAISDGTGQEAPVRQRVSRTRSSGIENVIVSEDQLEFDLSRWHLTVPEVTRIKTHKTFHQFGLHVVRRDVTPEIEWSIFRRYSEFEVLDSMLRKFFPGAKIGAVPRKILFISSQELETRRRELELYLTALLRVPELQQSELVCKFLCDINDDKIFQAENFGDHAGRMMRNIHKSILTDRHEFLSKPLDNFLESTAPPPYRHQSEVVSRVVSSRDKWLEDSREYSKVFDPPADPPAPPVPPTAQGTPLSISSWGELLQFAFHSVLTVPYPIRLLSAVLNLLLPYQTELWLQQWADQLIGQLSNESYLVFLIEKVRDTLYHSAPQVYNRDLLKSELLAQKHSLRERINSQIPKVAKHAIGKELLLCNLDVVLECFDNQENNQQLVSSLLDQIILELFPELT